MQRMLLAVPTAQQEMHPLQGGFRIITHFSVSVQLLLFREEKKEMEAQELLCEEGCGQRIVYTAYHSHIDNCDGQPKEQEGETEKVEDGKALSLIKHLGTFPVRIQHFDGGKVHYKVTKKTGIREIMNEIRSLYNIPQKNQNLLFNGKKLDEAGLVGDYGLKKGSVINLTHRCRGGL